MASSQDVVDLDLVRAAGRLRQRALASREDADAWATALGRALLAAGQPTLADALGHVKESWQLTNGHLGRILSGVTKQTVGGWLTHGIPAARQAEVAAEALSYARRVLDYERLNIA